MTRANTKINNKQTGALRFSHSTATRSRPLSTIALARSRRSLDRANDRNRSR